MTGTPEEFNTAKWVADFATQIFKNNIATIYGGGKKLLKGVSDEIQLLTDSYLEYLSCVAERYSITRSFLIRDESINLHEFYVPLGVSCGERQIPQASLATLLGDSRFAILTGSGGSGKSMMMRYLFLDAIKSQLKVPVFVELRDINDGDKTIVGLIKHALKCNKFGYGDEYIEKALKAGLFAVLLDGYDEVTNAKRKRVAGEIEQFTKDYDRNYVVVSSRPDLEFGGWQPFKVCEISPLTLEQACELVAKVPGDEVLKTKFTKDLRERLFKEHKSFLSNPLLLSIMLLTYRDNAEIPKKLSIFYKQAYDALFNRHDALKGTWQREHATDLDIQDFGKVFSAFSLLTYDKSMTSFTLAETVDFLKKSKQLTDINFKPENYIADAKKAVCLFVDDGRDLSFAHRSFQEYFTARFIAEAAPEVQEALIAKYFSNAISDKVIRLLYDINPDLVERVYIIPKLEELERRIDFKGELNLQIFSRFLLIADEIKLFDLMTKNIAIVLSYNEGSEIVDFLLLYMVLGDFSILNADNLMSKSEITRKEIKLLKSIKTRTSDDQFTRFWGGTKATHIPTERIAADSKLLEIVSRGDDFLSMHALSEFFKLKEKLVKKHSKVSKSLSQILKI